MGDLEDQLGKTVNVYKITESLNDYGDVTKGTSSTVSVVGELQVMTGDERLVRAGVLQTKDAIGFFSPNENIVEGDEIAYQGTTYTVIGLFKEQVGTTPVFLEAHLKNVVE